MVVSFKISKRGSKFQFKSKQHCAFIPDNDDPLPALPKVQVETNGKRSVDFINVGGDDAELLDVSFILCMFPDGYLIKNPSEKNDGYYRKKLCPYDSTSQSLFTAIECGVIPTDFLDGISCRYRNGKIMCEVRDYRGKSVEAGANGVAIRKVFLKMTLENVVKDIPLIADDCWTYGDAMEAESRIVKALHPKLCLDPTPNLERLCKDPASIKLNLDSPLKRLKQRQRQPANERSRTPPMIPILRGGGGGGGGVRFGDTSGLGVLRSQHARSLQIPGVSMPPAQGGSSRSFAMNPVPRGVGLGSNSNVGGISSASSSSETEPSVYHELLKVYFPFRYR